MNRIEVLNNIFDNFQQITQWTPNNLECATKYMAKAEALIELLEVKDCGSVGGFDHSNLPKDETSFKLYDRFLALVRKYDNEKDVRRCCDFTIKSLGQYFKKIASMRSEILKQ